MKINIFFILLAIFTGCAKNTIDYERAMDQIFKSYDSDNLPGASVMIIENGAISFEKGYGIADFENMTPISPSTNFRLASITKQFTAMSILLLIEGEKLSFETTIGEIFPDFPEYGDYIKIEHLLRHTSGLIDYEDLIPDTATIQVKDKDVLNFMMTQDSTYFVPGTEHRYSNSGYAVLAMVVEKISNSTFAYFLMENIFKPLEMNNTAAHEKGISTVPSRAYGYTILEDSIEFTDQSLTSAVLGDGGIYSSTRDLYRWDQALYGNKVIDTKYIQMAFSKGTTTNGETFDYGLGWRLENYKNFDVTYHTGSSIGFRNIFYRIPAKKFSLIILTNRDQGGEMSTLDIAHQIVDEFLVH